MATVIRPGKRVNQTAEHRCWRCESIVMYSFDDIEGWARDRVTCPVCGYQEAASKLDWQGPGEGNAITPPGDETA